MSETRQTKRRSQRHRHDRTRPSAVARERLPFLPPTPQTSSEQGPGKARWKDFWTHTVKRKRRPDLGECWEWQGAKQNTGYAQLMVKGKRWLVHRYAWTLVHGPIPDDLLVLHNCDNRRCCRPEHLRLGTYHDNMVDMVQRGRGSKILSAPGELNSAAKLTWEQVDAIREEVAEVLEAEALYGIPRYGYLTRIGRRYGVGPGTVKAIVEGKTWKLLSRRCGRINSRDRTTEQVSRVGLVLELPLRSQRRINVLLKA